MTPQGPVAFEIEKHGLRERTGRDEYKEHKFDLRYTRRRGADAMIDGLPGQPIALKTASIWPTDESLSMKKYLTATLTTFQRLRPAADPELGRGH